jgi:purine-binding chemotaxis protein CheW
VPVIDLKKRFDLPPGQITDNTRIIIVTLEDITVGMIVDSATEVIQLPQEAIEPAPTITNGIDSNFLDGVGKLDGKLLILLNLSKVLKPQEITQLSEM